MRPPLSLLSLLISFAAVAQVPPAPKFDVAAVKPSEQQVGPDYNNQFTIVPTRITARHATLRRLVSEAYHVQVRQVLGPHWLDEEEYDIDARTESNRRKETLVGMLRELLAERFQLQTHTENRDMRVYELVTDKDGPKIQPVADGGSAIAGPGFHFQGDMRQFADFLAVQLSIPIADDPSQPVRAGGPMIPVLDKTGLEGIYSFTAEVRPELGIDSFSLWQRTLRDKLGLRIESRRGPVQVVVVDSASRIPTAN